MCYKHYFYNFLLSLLFKCLISALVAALPCPFRRAILAMDEDLPSTLFINCVLNCAANLREC
jgi:hypothetical protein